MNKKEISEMKNSFHQPIVPLQGSAAVMWMVTRIRKQN